MTPATMIEQAFAPAAAAIDSGNIPCAVLGVVTANGERAVHWAGHAQIEPVHELVSRETWFDLASLTKVIFTTARILHFVEAGRIALDDPLVTVIPDLRQYDLNAAERRLTFRQCLAHNTHLPAVEPLYTYGQDPGTLRAFILQRVWQPGPPVYSDINFMLLGIAIERITGQALIDQPLPERFSFRPDPKLCAATEKDTWRGRIVRGEVHDENAFALGGASGHAGLFGTIDGVLDFALSLLDGSALSPESIRAIRTRESEKRTVGWEGFYPGWHGGDACSPETIGHTGFTGTGLWIDFERGLAWSLLTNRVHPSRHKDSGILNLRRATGERAVALFDQHGRLSAT
ncbi:serine hydrolase domain-containing protein [Microvirga arsenatis]|uniref:Serine hydrolase n=1 Tax=Microvirga arsenatis TaxID=2692265 RepID=A0ABW9YT53_9HYPH|nr:serine hydrolase [Microvirga arsenatis]NBJ09740.1 serine hydrolase [Microvirga arsenatis]NBJ23401.1 serine hydrolase [Microvirga arsenatis]